MATWRYCYESFWGMIFSPETLIPAIVIAGILMVVLWPEKKPAKK